MPPFELRSADPSIARQFYCSLFGWEFETAESAGMAILNGTHSIGVLVASANPPAQWVAVAASGSAGDPGIGDLVSFEGAAGVLVERVDEVAARVAPLGGRLLGGPADVPGVGRVARLLDPQGAALAIVQQVVSA